MKNFYIIFALNGNWGKYIIRTKDIEGCDQAICLFVQKIKKVMTIDSFSYEIFETEEEAKNFVWENCLL